jgi:hypothetical protein
MPRIAEIIIPSPTRRPPRALVTVATVLLGFIVAGHPALASDLRSPDARDAAGTQATPPAQTETDLRSPDVRDVAKVAAPRVSSDLRSPDTRDLGRSGTRASSPPTSRSDGGFPWIYLALGAFGLTLLATGATTLRVRRRVKHAPAVIGG